MKPEPVVPRDRARQDVREAVEYYVSEAGADTAIHFIDRLESAYRTIAAHPAIGSPRYTHELGLPGLRSWQLKTYSWLIFYMELDDRIYIWRVLHAQRDIPAHMQGPDEPS
jgi:toxin ParE1/3/4